MFLYCKSINFGGDAVHLILLFGDMMVCIAFFYLFTSIIIPGRLAPRLIFLGKFHAFLLILPFTIAIIGVICLLYLLTFSCSTVLTYFPGYTFSIFLSISIFCASFMTAVVVGLWVHKLMLYSHMRLLIDCPQPENEGPHAEENQNTMEVNPK